jgi:polysaccharide biosynthesis transport protein
MRELTGQLAGLDEEIRAAAGKAVRGFEDEARLAGAQVSNLEGLIAKQAKAVATSDADQVQLRALQLDAKTAREQLESYINKYREASARDADDATPANARVIATAQEPLAPTFPKKAPTVLLATLAGFLLAAGIVVARALLEAPGAETYAAPAMDPAPAMTPTAAVAPAPAMPGANAVPEAVDEPPTEASTAPADFDENEDEREERVDPTTALEAIVDRLAETAETTHSLTVLVTGEATKGALALGLTAARRLSKTGRAVLVDLGVSQPWLGDVFDHGEEPDDAPFGLADLLEGRTSFDQALHRDLSARLDILPAGTGEIDPDQLEPVLAALAQSYVFVVIHASNWRSPAVAAAIGGVGAVIVCAPAARLEAAKERLQQGFADPTIVTVGVALPDRAPLDRVA